MNVGRILALIALIIGFFVGAGNGHLWFNALTWFIAAIAIVLVLGDVGPVVFERRPKE